MPKKRATSLIRYIAEDVVSSPVSITAGMSFASPSQGQGTSPKEMTSGDGCVNLWTPTSCVFLAPTPVVDGRVFLRIEKLLPSIVQSTYSCSSSSGEACSCLVVHVVTPLQLHNKECNRLLRENIVYITAEKRKIYLAKLISNMFTYFG